MNLTDKIRAFKLDCIEYMKTLPDNFYDYAVCDIEYGVGADKPSVKNSSVKQKNGKKLNIKQSKFTHKDWDKLSSDEYFNELFRVSKNQIIFGGNYYGLKGGYLVWDKLNGETDQFGRELAWLSFTKRTDIVYYLWSGMIQGLLASKALRKALLQQGNKKLNQKRIHETEKPIKLYEFIFLEYIPKGSRVLDTHGGSMSIAQAANNLDKFLDLKLDICENNDEHYKNATNRFFEYFKNFIENKRQMDLIDEIEVSENNCQTNIFDQL